MRMYLLEIGWENVEWIQLAQDRAGGDLLWMRWWIFGFWRQGAS
jgi:hypothetical protein